MTVPRSILLFALAALAEIAGGGWSGRASANIAAWPLLAPHRCPWPLRPRGHLPTRPRLRAHPGCLRRGVRGRLPGLGVLVDGFRPDRYDLVGTALCLAGVAVIMYAQGQLDRPDRTDQEGAG